MSAFGSNFVRIACLLLLGGGSTSAAAWGWWERCYGYHCYGPPYGNYAPAPGYVYDPQKAPTWTGNGWAQLPVESYQPAPVYPVYPAPPPRRWLLPFW